MALSEQVAGGRRAGWRVGRQAGRQAGRQGPIPACTRAYMKAGTKARCQANEQAVMPDCRHLTWAWRAGPEGAWTLGHVASPMVRSQLLQQSGPLTAASAAGSCVAVSIAGGSAVGSYLRVPSASANVRVRSARRANMRVHSGRHAAWAHKVGAAWRSFGIHMAAVVERGCSLRGCKDRAVLGQDRPVSSNHLTVPGTPSVPFPTWD